MRIGIQWQLSFFVIFITACAVVLPSIISWTSNYNFTVQQRTARLSLLADVRSRQLRTASQVLINSCSSVSSRIIIQNSLRKYDNGNGTWSNFSDALVDIAVALATQPFLIASTLWDKDLSRALLNVTAKRAIEELPHLPRPQEGQEAVGNDAGYSWDGHSGFSDELYPRSSVARRTPEDKVDLMSPEFIVENKGLFLGPVPVNDTLEMFLASYTIPVFDSRSNNRDLLGFFTIVVDAYLMVDVVRNKQGLDGTGQVMILGPNNPTNKWDDYQRNDNVNETTKVRYILPPLIDTKLYNTTVELGSFAAAKKAYTGGADDDDNAPNMLDTRAASGQRISVGFKIPGVRFTDWVLVVQQSYDEVVQPVIHLRNILLITIFCTCAAVALLVCPLAHFFVRPISRLQVATQNSTRPPSYSPFSDRSMEEIQPVPSIPPLPGPEAPPDEKGSTRMGSMFNRRRRRSKDSVQQSRGLVATTSSPDGRVVKTFRIPSKVRERKYMIRDELTDLTHVFNEMTEELTLQYENLEERVKSRTRELHEQKKLAESANEAKSHFIANITHELRTPLNGILGMCAVCLDEEDIMKIKHSLGIVYKSGELLLHLLTDLLSFSKTQFGRQTIRLDNREFRMVDITTQVMTIFEKNARENKISLSLQMVPESILTDTIVWGDSNRLLQVLINLISNGLKFTPENGAISIRIILGPEDTSGTRLSRVSFSQPGTTPGSRQNSTHSLSTPLHGKSSSMKENTAVTPSTLNESSTTNVHRSPSNGSVHPPARKGVPHVHSMRDSEDGQSTPVGATHWFQFEVEDNGPGIPIDSQAKIFEPFVQGELGLNKRFGGTGLGLSICRQLAMLMKGNIELRSTVGVGSNFILRVPLRIVKESASSIASRDRSLQRRGSRDSTSVINAQTADMIAVASHADEAGTGINNVTGGGVVTPTVTQEKKLTPQPSPSTAQRPTVSSNTSNTSTSAAAAAAAAAATAISSKPRLVGLSSPFFAPESPPGDLDLNIPHLDSVHHSIESSIKTKIRAAKTANPTEPSIRVLVAEDNLINQEVVMRMLQLEFISDITLAKDGQEAVNLVKTAIEHDKPFHIVFMDIQMPNLDGLESTRIIRRMGYTSPIVALSAFTEENNIQDCYDSGMNDFLSKPIRRRHLKNVLKRYCHTIIEQEDGAADEKPKTDDKEKDKEKEKEKGAT